ncbi:MAG: hypothetical protein WCT85_06760 [Parachlamydiales bacterium]|jgi:hypothetical protein
MKFITKFIFSISLLLATQIFSEERIDVNSRPLSEQEIKEISEKQKTESEGTNQKDEFNTRNPYYSHLIFNISTHSITNINDDSLTIEDGSEWKIRPIHINEVLSWGIKDPILIVLNDSFISSYFYGYKYKMINAEKNTSIDVKLNLGPLLNNPKTLKVLAIDFESNEITLSDATLWKCNNTDLYMLQKWLKDDGIIVGTNTKGYLFNRSQENILINVNMLQEIRVSRLK